MYEAERKHNENVNVPRVWKKGAWFLVTGSQDRSMRRPSLKLLPLMET